MWITELSVSVLLSNLVGLFLLIGAGFGAVRGGLIPSEAASHLTTLLMKITVPATIFSSMIRPFDMGFLKNALLIFGLGFVFSLLYAVLGWLLTRLLRVPEGRRGMWMMCSTFSNCGFMGYPVAYALFGDEGLALAVILCMACTILMYTLGVKMILLDREKTEEEEKVSWGKVMVNIINLSIVLGLIFYILQIPVPAMIFTPIQYLANVTTPLSMFVIGMNLAKGRLADVIRDREAILASAARLLIFPVVTWAVFLLFPTVDLLVKDVFIIIMAMPSAAVSTIIGGQYRGNTELAARTVFLSSLLCIVTIPLISLLL